MVSLWNPEVLKCLRRRPNLDAVISQWDHFILRLIFTQTSVHDRCVLNAFV
jgi:hypothetical protein